MAINGKTRSFRKGWQYIRPVDMPSLKEKIMGILGINNRNDWGKCLGIGKKMYDIQAAAIEREFIRLNVPQHEVWDDPKENWEVVILEATGNVRLQNTLTGERYTFGSISELIMFARREHIELTVGSVKVNKAE